MVSLAVVAASSAGEYYTENFLEFVQLVSLCILRRQSCDKFYSQTAMRGTPWKDLLLLAGSLLVSLYLVEAVLAVVRFKEGGVSLEEQRYRRAQRMGRPFDRRSRFEVYQARRSSGEDLVPAIYPSSFLEDPLVLEGEEVVPLSGLASRQTLLCNESGQYVEYRSDERGFANPPGAFDSAVDIAVLGDSYAHGFCVKPEASSVALIRKEFPRTVNLGYGGDGPLLEYATLREYAAALRPKVVVWLYFEGNDLGDLEKELKNSILVRYLRDGFSQQLSGREKSLDAALSARIEGIVRTEAKSRGTKQHAKKTWKSCLVDIALLRNTRREAGIFRRGRRPTNGLDDLSRILSRCNSEIRTWGGSLIFVYVPEWKSVRWRAVDYYGREEVLGLAKGLGIDVVDLYEGIRSLPDSSSLWPYGLRGHFNEAGYRFLADKVIAEIRKNSPELGCALPAPPASR